MRRHHMNRSWQPLLGELLHKARTLPCFEIRADGLVLELLSAIREGSKARRLAI